MLINPRRNCILCGLPVFFTIFLVCLSNEYPIDQTIQHRFIKLPDHTNLADFIYEKPDITILSIRFIQML